MSLTNIDESLALEAAIENEIPISFQYWKPSDWEAYQKEGIEPKRRIVSPYELRDGKDPEDMKTLLICWAHDSEGVRSFDTDRIMAVRSEEGVEDFVFPVEAARSYRVVSGRPGFEGLVEQGAGRLVRVDADRACRVKTERVN